MKRALYSFAFGVLFTFVLLMLPSVSRAVAPISVRLLFVSSYLFSWHYFGLDCPNADSIADKMNCFWINVTGTILLYSVLCYVVLWLIGRRRRSSVIPPKALGNTLDLSN